MLLRKKDKRGDTSSLIIGLIIMIFIVAVISMVAGKFIPELMDIMKNQEEIASNNDSVAVLNLVETKTIPFLDYFFLFLFFGTIIGIIISSIYIDTHPAFIIGFIIVLIIAIIFAGLFANTYVTMGESSTLSTTYDQFTSTKAIFNNLPMILFAVGLIVIIILYGKSRNAQGGMM